MNSSPKKRDSLGFTVRFVCGAVAGILVGIGFWMPETIAGVLITGLISGVACGLLAAFWGDRFWEMLSSFLR
ncbi:MAG: hypothetical protein LRZ84_26655 [Desertifilum sp.]|nr:hypothetical protein [Desertifilum sp.]MDI9640130.1 hypothetical protein [Geitlerinema splendidum]